MSYIPGDIVTTDVEKLHHVYELIDDNDCVFYIGVTSDPVQRLKAHVAGSKYARNNTVQEKIRTLAKPRMRIVSVYESRKDAERLEILLIGSTPGLLNTHPGPRLVESYTCA